MLSTTTATTILLSSRNEILAFLYFALPIALLQLVALIVAGWGVYLLIKYTSPSQPYQTEANYMDGTYKDSL